MPQVADTPPFWYPCSYDFNAFSEKKVAEKLDYIHWNPVKRGLVASPDNGDGVLTGFMPSEKKDQ